MLQGDIDGRGCREGVPAFTSSLACLTAPNQLAPANLGMTFPLVNSAAASTACLLSPPSVPLTSAAPITRGMQGRGTAETERPFAPSQECGLGLL